MHYKTALVLALASVVSARTVHHKKQILAPALPAGWAAAGQWTSFSSTWEWLTFPLHIGCYTDSWDRTLATQVSANNNQLTTESCIAACNGYTYAGTENGNECYCSNTLASTGSKAADGDCSVPCSGNNVETCGGGWRLSVYQYSAATWPDPPFIPYVSPPPGWLNAGCYSDSWTRTLANSVNVTGSLSRESCTAACDAGEYTYAGVENGDECYCSNTVASTGVITSDEDCSTPCAGSADTCGGGWRLNIFQKEDKGTLFWPLSGWSSLGCYTDSWTRTLGGPSYTSNSITSAADCIRSCLLDGYRYAGVENGDECYCGHGIATTGTPAPNEDCLTPCAGGPYYCGGGWRLSIYHDNYN